MRNLQPPPKNCDTLGIHEKSEQDDCEDNRGESGETCNLNPDDRAKNPGIRKDLQPQRGPQRQGGRGQLTLPNSAASNQDKPQPPGRCRYPELTYKQPASDVYSKQRHQTV